MHVHLRLSPAYASARSASAKCRSKANCRRSSSRCMTLCKMQSASHLMHSWGRCKPTVSPSLSSHSHSLSPSRTPPPPLSPLALLHRPLPARAAGADPRRRRSRAGTEAHQERPLLPSEPRSTVEGHRHAGFRQRAKRPNVASRPRRRASASLCLGSTPWRRCRHAPSWRPRATEIRRRLGGVDPAE
jgi:hypothetical protein